MNVGNHPEGMSSERRELIEGLELHGYNNHAGVPANWRDSVPSDQLAYDLATLEASAIEGIPEVDEMVATIRELIAAEEAFNAANPDRPDETDTGEWRRYAVAFGALRGLSRRIDRTMQEAFS